MKVDLKITFSQLEVLVSTFSLLKEIHIKNRENLVARSVLDKVTVKVKKKHINESIKSYSNKKKKFKLSFEYYEAHFLERFLEIAIILYHKESFERAVLTLLKEEINQKLA